MAATSEVVGGADVSASAVSGELKPLRIGPQPPPQQVNWLNLFYSVEWIVFAGFALFIWWRMVKDDYRRDLEDELDDEHDEHHQHTEEAPQSAQQANPSEKSSTSEQKVQP